MRKQKVSYGQILTATIPYDKFLQRHFLYISVNLTISILTATYSLCSKSYDWCVLKFLFLTLNYHVLFGDICPLQNKYGNF